MLYTKLMIILNYMYYVIHRGIKTQYPYKLVHTVKLNVGLCYYKKIYTVCFKMMVNIVIKNIKFYIGFKCIKEYKLWLLYIEAGTFKNCNKFIV